LQKTRSSSNSHAIRKTGLFLCGNDAAVIVCSVLCGITFSEIGLRLLLLTSFGKLKIFAINEVGFALAPFAAYAWWATRHAGLRGLALTFAGLMIGYLAISRFRGLWVWKGTFDAYWMPATSWAIPVAIGSAIGIAAGFRSKREKSTCFLTANVWIGILLLCSLIELVGSQLFAEQIDSAYPPTRSYIMLATLVVVLVSRGVEKWSL
jgi:hypothetical protein